jgi:hypothetical protein
VHYPVSLVVLAVFLGAPAGLPAGPLAVDTSWEWGGGLSVRGALALDSALLTGACRNGSAFAAAIETPWLRAGPLCPAGLLRVAYDPLGFSPQSEVFSELTGLVIDSTLESEKPGIVMMPVPEILGMYFVNDPPGTFGWCASLVSPQGSGVEGFLSLSRPLPEPPGDEWVSSRPLYPGGQLLVAGTRILFAVPGLEMAAALGASQGEQVGQGAFWQLRASVHGAGAWAVFLAAGADREYRTPRGTGFDEGQELAAACGVAGAPGSARLLCSFLLCHPEMAPHPCRATREALEAGGELVLARRRGVEVALGAQGRVRVARGADGGCEVSPRCAAALRVGVGRFRASAGVEGVGTETLALFLDTELLRRAASPGFACSSRWEADRAGGVLLTGFLCVRVPLDQGSIAVQAGVERLPAAAGRVDLRESLRLRLSWTAGGATNPRPGSPPARG